MVGFLKIDRLTVWVIGNFLSGVATKRDVKDELDLVLFIDGMGDILIAIWDYLRLNEPV